VELPARLQRYDGLIDYLVEQLMREVADPKKETPDQVTTGAGADLPRLDQHEQDLDEAYKRAPSAATIARN
jgi:hypothetical protein